MTALATAPARTPGRARGRVGGALMGLGLLLLVAALMSFEWATPQTTPALVLLTGAALALFVGGGALSGRPLTHWISLDCRLF
ncbi:hypothetical protein [Deinococcus rufus]|uniref:Uncharacterized protein n=1 Tax=Deinococcus rufus TaxID=2136097 RepID=A0ABV7ZAW6_9DEIO